jgi:ParB-like chromosome segregation protein Spo0J
MSADTLSKDERAAMDQSLITNWAIHPLCLKFPELPPDKYEELKESIRKVGLLEPVVLNISNQILDGRHRYKACMELGIMPHTALWTTMTRKNPNVTEAEFIFAANYHRRHLTDDQRLQIRAAFFPLIQEETGKAQAESLPKAREAKAEKSVDSKSSPQKRDLKTKHERSAVGKLAKQAETSEHKAKQAIDIEKVPDIAEKVRNGELTRPEAIKVIEERKALENGVQTILPLNGSTEPEKGPKLLTPEKLTDKVSKWCEIHLGNLLNSLHQDQLELALDMVINECRTTINECKAAREAKEETCSAT